MNLYVLPTEFWSGCYPSDFPYAMDLSEVVRLITSEETLGQAARNTEELADTLELAGIDIEELAEAAETTVESMWQTPESVLVAALESLLSAATDAEIAHYAEFSEDGTGIYIANATREELLEMTRAAIARAEA